jgi:hypothetical protein
MPFERIPGICLWIVITSAVAAAQQDGAATSAAPLPATSVSERTYPTNGLTPLRRTDTRTESGGGATVETVEAPGIDGKPEPLQESVSETTRTGPTTTQTRRDVFVFGAQHQRKLWEATQSDQETQANGDTRNVQSTWMPDLNGRLVPTSGRIDERTSVAAGVTQTNATVLRPALDESLREVDLTESTERQIDPATVRRDSTHLIRDVNGRWLPTEARSAEARSIGSRGRVEEETIQRPDLNGKLLMSDRIVTNSSESNADSQVEIETYSQYAEGFVRSDSRLALSQRIRTSTTATADGGRSSVEEVEARNPVAPNEPMRVVRRTVVTVRRVGSDRFVTERQTFERDVNDRLVLVTTDTEENAGK